MNNSWIKTPLGDVLKQIQRQTAVNPTETYNLLGIRLDGGGVFLRESKEGSTISATKLNQVQTGDFIYSRLFAWRGAFGIITSEFDGCYVSNEFPTFLPKNDSIDIRFLNYWFRLPETRRKVEADCSGSTPLTRNRFKEHFFLNLEIPLPPLPKQQRIVEKIERLAGKIEEARGLQASNLNKSTAFILSLHFGMAQDRKVKMGEIFKLDELRIPVEAEKEYPQVGIKSFGGGLFSKLSIPGTATSYNYFNHLKAGMLVLSQVKGWEGAVAICPNELDGYFASPEYRTFSCKPERCLPEYIRNIVITSWFAKKLQAATHGVGGRRERVRPEKFLEIEIPMPIVQKQYEAIKIFQSLNEISSLRMKIEKKIEALLPSILDKAFKGEL